ncbi:MAG: phasin family protein [Parvularculaceae bacterium]|jgi:hypothetical protein|nr:phasin family protein [Parvularculaceae bacterium]
MAAKKTVRKSAKLVADNTVDAFNAGASFTTAANDQFQTVLNAFSENAETLRGQTEEVMSALRSNLEATQSRLQSISADMAEAARTEASEAVTFVNELARAKTMADALEIQRNYWTNLFETRVERTRELAKTSVEVARESFQPLSKSFSSLPAFASFEKLFPFASK